jgi:phosphomannomutase
MAVQAELRATVDAWIDDDPDEHDREELRALLDRAAGDDEAAAELRDRFTGRLTFGTAGLRGVMGAGPNRMNLAVVRAATAAVAGWLTESVATPAVAVGCDARHRSAGFADEVARVLAGAGVRVLLLPRPGPTPLLAFAVRRLAASAGVMITASHNPAADNGYKLYLSGGAQVIPPVDAEIESRITRLGPLTAIPAASLDDPLIVRLGDEVTEAYLKAVTAPFAGGARAVEPRLAVVYTPLHGVAGDLMLRAIERAGFAAPRVVAAQAAPDPDFPTARFPNPEEPGVLDLALAEAQRQGADLVLASDPDGDRLAVAWPGAPGAPAAPAAPGTPAVPSTPAVIADGAWRMLTGDQLGALLGGYLLETEGAQLTSDGIRPLVATTIVSSTLLSKIAAAAGAWYRETLTGFKWIARAADEIDARGGADVRFVFGYEEALGYMVGQVVRDKDGFGAALAVLSLAATAKLRGRTLHDAYDDLERAHGVHLTEQLTLRIPDTAAVMRRIRATPPSALGGFPVQAVTDYADRGTGLPQSDVLSYALPLGRVAIRPSGTEPKVKAYLEVVEPAGDDLAAARAVAAGRMAPLRASVTELLTS